MKPSPEIDAKLLEIAQEEGAMADLIDFNIQNLDSLDFHDMHIGSIYQMLRAAFEAGYIDGAKDAQIINSRK